ncbi:unnamed protein product [Brassicogethes aeneus]|uniref:Protein wntless n=1 Tax=Brassicogethes aeneus TaxID=1431903 RepID=A0A9P0BKY3_BRAAE|nr:unnamed protein product [Brassicogethes aeneus]
MPGTILENLSGKKLSVLVGILLTFQLACFLVGLIAPSPANFQNVGATFCVDRNPDNKDENRWFTRQCKESLHDLGNTTGLSAKNIVFVFEMPLFRVDFSRWQQKLVGMVHFEQIYQEGRKLTPTVQLSIDARLAYADKTLDGARTPWTRYAHAQENRHMDCDLDAIRDHKDGYPYDCSMVPLFELGNLYHDYYLLNVRLPQSQNSELGRVHDVQLNVIFMNGGFTKVCVSMKTVFFPLVLGVLLWFWRRVFILSRTPALLEYMLLSLGVTLAVLNFPLEYFSLYFDMPYMLILSDVRQGVFYAMLLSFWLVFAGEHMLIQDNGEKNCLKMYWKHLSTIAVGCMSLLIFDLCERGVQLVNPFYSIWVTPTGTHLALSFVILAGLSACMYFLFLCYMVWCVFKNISIKRSVLPSMSQARRLHYEGIIYRFNFLMAVTLICAAVTVVSFILSQVAEGQNKWDEELDFEVSSVLYTGVYGMWNVYICGMLMLYAPSHKQWPSDPTGQDGEELEFSRLPTESVPSEISSLTSFATKASIE